jgi:hypothetical protein
MPFIKNLVTLGIEANLRIVDPVQYRNASTNSTRPHGAAVRVLEYPGRLVAQLLFLAGGHDARLAELDPVIDALIEKSSRPTTA